MTAPAVYSFTVPGNPVGKARARVCVNRGKVHSFTPAKTANFENLVRLAFVGKYPQHVPLEGALSLIVTAYFPVPKSMKVPKEIDWAKDFIPHTHRPDADNVSKSICDAGNGVIWKDDSQIYHMQIYKIYSLTPRTEIVILYAAQAISPGNREDKF